ncbi:protein CASPARIAN STRIP INTEGRITY FACTOR 1-like [Mangifera indica]|uniref:protein CASPARIAN STRIP INTEGRITY FACTOR 1-like n=1 Tax=Mangifera indica TaxID=29780 RepID=UPI001CFB45A1|nr:protein CASPARIAN STRIP INTEGRITY FACTOR 1-like [Mangifera indica]
MGLMLLRKICLLFLLVSSSLLSTCLAGRRISMSVNKLGVEVEATHQDKVSQREEMSVIHERLLKVNTKDYGRYDPSPTFVKPPFKLIPN